MALLHGQPVADGSLLFLGVVTLAALATALLLGLALAAFVRRRSQPYLLIACAAGALVARSLVTGLTLTGTLSAGDHHLLEHGLDVTFVALVVGAVYYARHTPTDDTPT